MQGKKYTSDFWNKTFLEVLKNSLGSITHACKEAGVTPQSYYAYRLKNPVFAKKADVILETICLPILEDMARSRAMKTSDKLLMFLLRNLGGKKWNQDRIEEALAKQEPKLLLNEKYKKVIDEQRVPSYAERAAAEMYRATLRKYQAKYGNSTKGDPSDDRDDPDLRAEAIY